MPHSSENTLLVEWSKAVEQVDLELVQRLFEANPELLWAPIVNSAGQTDDHAHLQSQLERFQLLGLTFDDLNALQYTLLDYHESPEDTLSPVQREKLRLLSFFVEEARVEDLDNQRWGDCSNTTLHLSSFLGQRQITEKLLVKGAKLNIPNDLGYLPCDVAQNEDVARTVADKQVEVHDKPAQKSTRFKQLREMSKPNSIERKTTMQREVHYFRAGHVEETKQKVLNEEEAELMKQRARRQKEVALLAKRSAVKNNPFVKRAESKHIIAPKKRILSENTQNQTLQQTGSRRNSKVISALKDKSYVSASVFRQTEPLDMLKPDVLLPNDQSTPDLSSLGQLQNELIITEGDDLQKKEQSAENTKGLLDADERTDVPGVEGNLMEDATSNLSENSSQDTTDSLDIIENNAVKTTEQHLSIKTENDQPFNVNQQTLSPVEPPERRASIKVDDMDTRRLSGSQKAHWSIAMNSWAAVLDREFQLQELGNPQTVEQKSVDDNNGHEADVGHSSDNERSHLELPKGDESESRSYTIITGEEPKRLQNTTIRRSMTHDDVGRYMTESLTSSTFSSPSPSVTHSLDNLALPIISATKDKEHSESPIQRGAAFGSISVRPTSSYSHRLPQSDDSSEADGASDDLELEQKKKSQPRISKSNTVRSLVDEVPVGLSTSALYDQKPQYTKLYIRVNGVNDILLPLPKERTYVRCVVSDGRFEYMSRYELLGQQVVFDYECIVDTHPDMIITVSLHVRPDCHVKAKAPIARLFTSTRKRKETLSGYVSHEDGAIGQTRFALAHMLHACYQKPYAASFHCFNAWYARSLKERHRQQRKLGPDQDILKVIGNLDLEMLCVPVADPSLVSQNTTKKKGNAKF
ncbi:hypothetical protein DFQ28_003810 [Apophysomyces sp. BC1034]|nr:hypothetical protein DFQ30_000215 [Apophysomyces sp. BC1015]KAG0178767.1 hypothetical protein DFQ29_003044 [Apophysomyces sp. BC1021]KAG0189147.1 hypothetical protein DFQ28_003810 [Apophysomyces sp. BC1034]